MHPSQGTSCSQFLLQSLFPMKTNLGQEGRRPGSQCGQNSKGLWRDDRGDSLPALATLAQDQSSTNNPKMLQGKTGRIFSLCETKFNQALHSPNWFDICSSLVTFREPVPRTAWKIWESMKEWCSLTHLVSGTDIPRSGNWREALSAEVMVVVMVQGGEGQKDKGYRGPRWITLLKFCPFNVHQGLTKPSFLTGALVLLLTYQGRTSLPGKKQ